MTLKLRYYGDPVLRKKAELISEVNEEIKTLAHEMIDLMLASRGCGLAGNQVGVLLRLFVSNVEREEVDGTVVYGEPKVYINPTLTNPSKVMVEMAEGCLSIPKLYVPVERPLSVTIEATDINGNRFTKECHGFLARNMMHENDHLNGVLHIDRVKGKKRREIDPILQQIKERYYTG